MAAAVPAVPTAPPIATGSSAGSARMLGSDGSRKGNAVLVSTKRNRSRQPGSTGLAPALQLPKADVALGVGATNPPAGGFKHHLDAVTANIEAPAAAVPPAKDTSTPPAAKRTASQRSRRQLASPVSPLATGILDAAASSPPPPVASATPPTLTAQSASVKPTVISQGSPVGTASIPVTAVLHGQQSTLSSNSEPSVRAPVPSPTAALSRPASASRVPTAALGGGLTQPHGGSTLVAITRTAQPLPSASEPSSQAPKASDQPSQATSGPAMTSLLSASVVSAQTAVAHAAASGPASPALRAPITPEGATAPPAQQVLAVLSPILSTASGTHRISLELHPAELGSIQATITVSGSQVTVELHADNAATRQTIGSALPDLRQQLGSGGQQAHVFFGGDVPRRQTGYSDRPLGVTSDSSAGAQPTQILIRPATSASSVDIRL